MARILVAILLGICCGQFLPGGLARIFVTFNSLFGNFLGFCIPLIIVGLVVPSISELGKGSGRLLALTVLLAYGSTLFSGFFTYFSCEAVCGWSLATAEDFEAIGNPGDFMLAPYFVVAMPPLMDVMTALLLAFTIGLGLAYIPGSALRQVCVDGRDVVVKLIEHVIIPLLPLHIFGIFLNMSVSGQALVVIQAFLGVICVLAVLHVVLLLMQFGAAGLVCKRNPLKLLRNMMPAYFTALGTQSSAATIPVTLEQTVKNGVSREIATFTIPLCATIHLSGSTMKIVACSMALVILTGGQLDFASYAGFICMLGITMVAAPGVPGGAIMAALGLLKDMLGFDETLQALMIAIYVAIDSFGTACNVTGDGAIALVVDRISGRKAGVESAPNINN